MIDLWNRLELIFAIPEQVFPEIEIIDLTPEGTRQLADYVVHHMRGVTTQFRTFSSEDVQVIPSVGAMLEGVATGELIGALGGELSVSNYILPEVLFIFEEPGYTVMSYSTGYHWNPVGLIGLFEFFRIVNNLGANATIRLSPQSFSQDWIRVFNTLLRSYLNE
jgi:hypothetical protein